VKRTVEAVNNFSNKRYDGFPISRNGQSFASNTNIQTQEEKPEFESNDGVQTSRLQVEDNDIPPFLKKLREHRN
ncbi:MAG: hypothetical protein IKA42_05995, partial [Clostridia bacterium]|nr:hypothetical protein [Clostridia bacterium]